MKLKIKNFIFILLFLLSISIFAYNPISNSQFMGYKGEGGFVESPTYVGSAVGCIIMGYPAAIVTEPLRLIVPNSPLCDAIGYYMVDGTSKGLGAAFGFIPFIFKKIFYDTPTAIAGKSKPDHSSEESIKLPKELVTPPVPEDIGEVKNQAVDKADLVPDQALELKSPEELKAEKQKAEEKQKLTTEAETKKQEKSESGAKTEERKELHKETKKAVVEEKTIEKPKPIEVNPNLPSWIHQELGSADNKDNH